MSSKSILIIILSTFLLSLLISIAERDILLIEVTLWFLMIFILLQLDSVKKWISTLPSGAATILAIVIVLIGTIGVFWLNREVTLSSVLSMKRHILQTSITVVLLLLIFASSFFTTWYIAKKNNRSHR